MSAPKEELAVVWNRALKTHFGGDGVAISEIVSACGAILQAYLEDIPEPDRYDWRDEFIRQLVNKVARKATLGDYVSLPVVFTMENYNRHRSALHLIGPPQSDDDNQCYMLNVLHDSGESTLGMFTPDDLRQLRDALNREFAS